MSGFFKNSQVEKVPKDLGLSFKWTNPDRGANTIIVEGVIEFKPFSCNILDTRTNTRYVEDTTKIFIKLCEELAEEKNR